MNVKRSILSGGLAAAVVAAAFVLFPSTSTLSPMPVLLADSLNCNLSQYKAAPGLTAAVEQDTLLVSWAGQNGADLRARYAIDSGQPVMRDLAVKKAGGQWTTLGKNLTPEYHVVSGIRRIADDQTNTLKAAGIELTDEVITKNRWYAFWDSPLVMPGSQEMQDEAAWRRSQQGGGGGGRGGRGQAPAADSLIPNRTLGTPRTPSDIRRADSSFHTTSCSVKTDGASLVVTFPGLSMGIFAGDLQFTVYKGTNLVRMDAAAKTNEPWVAYKYDARPEGILDRPHAARHLARHRRSPAASPVRRRGQHDAGARAGAEPADRGRSQRRRARGVSATTHLLLHPREGHQPRLRVVPEGRRREVRHRRRLPRA